MIKNTRLLLALLGASLFAHAQQVPAAIIPEPVSTQWHSGSFHIDAGTIIEATDSDVLSANFFNDYLHRFYGLHLQVHKGDLQPAANAIILRTQAGQGPDGRYTLESTANGVTITGSTHSGTFYGVQTLIQLLPTSPFQYTPHGPKVRAEHNGLEMPAVSILDYPRFAYRGLHLDVCRHFFPVDFVKRYIDFIALHKMNYFHWHLTDDQGWRIEIKKYPRLTEVGAWRSGTIIGHFPGTGNDSTEHGGYYTQDQVKEIVKYAADRYITVIPEIEMPGHASAALAAYPWLGCTGGPYQVQQTFGVFNDVYCAGKDTVFKFLEDVLDEVIPLFPCKYVHIGGDECPKTSWKNDPKCQQRMKELGLKTEDQLQSWFIQRIEKYVNSKGKQIIGWDEILEGGIAPNATIMSWRGEDGGIDAAKQHHDVIMTPGKFVYFDHAQTHNDDSLTIGGFLPLDTVYSYEPIPAALTGSDTAHVLGAQANLWTEYVSNVRKVEYMLFPRLSALSEVLWSPKASRNYMDFQNRLVTQYKRYALWGAGHYDVYFKPDSLVRNKIAEWQDRKFGLLMHWGTYSQWGIVESWSICPEDEGWTQRRGPYSKNYYDYLHAYENLKTTFNPTHFAPAKWAAAAEAAGMKYVVFTTKHHDGFCMFDTKQTDYKISSPQCPFSSNPKSNVAKEIFDAFRKDNFLIGAYFSKPDWHSDDYWWSYFPPKDRNVNYDPARYPDRWSAFKDYTYKQIEELMTGYGRMDLLWLDGGWVRPLSTVNPGVDWQRGIRYDQDVDMPKIAAMARSHQPGLIVVDRSVPGPYENYTTPEQQIPAHPMDDPWETCMTMGDSWSYVPHDHYKSTTHLIQLLVKIVSRGGNFLLNIGPSPEGDFDDTAYARLKEIGAWMKINGEGIYNSRPVAPWSSGNIYLTQAKDGSAVYAFLLGDGEARDIALPASITIERFTAKPKSIVTILGHKEHLHWKQEGKKMIIDIPANMQGKPAGEHALCFRIGA
jgi:N-acetyl-beta-hexosaminidase/alpha-L-fucosidase